MGGPEGPRLGAAHSPEDPQSRAEEFRARGVRSTSGFSLSSSLPPLALRSLSRLRGVEAWTGNPFLQLIASMAASVGHELLTRPPTIAVFVVASSEAYSVESLK